MCAYLHAEHIIYCHPVLNSQANHIGEFAGFKSTNNLATDDYAGMFGCDEFNNLFMRAWQMSRMAVNTFKKRREAGDPSSSARCSVTPAVPNPVSPMAVL